METLITNRQALGSNQVRQRRTMEWGGAITVLAWGEGSSCALVLASGPTLPASLSLKTILQTQGEFAAESKPLGNHFAPLSIRLRGKWER